MKKIIFDFFDYLRLIIPGGKIKLKKIDSGLSDLFFLDFKIFSDFAFQEKLKAMAAYTLFLISFLCFTYLTLFACQDRQVVSTRSLVWIFALLIIVNTLIMMPFLIKRLEKYANRIALFIFILAFFIGVAAGAFFAKILPDINIPDQNLILYLVGILTITLSIRLYGVLIKKVTRQKSAMESEIRLARNMQMQLVPEVDVENDRYQIFGRTISANEIGGDFFDVIAISKSKVVVAIGDVSGHNISAGLLMAITKGAFRSEIEHLDNLEGLVKSLNKTIFENSHASMFVSFLCGLFDIEQNVLTIVNGGHVPVLQFNHTEDGMLTEHLPAGIALGLSGTGTFTAGKIRFQPGDSFCFFTDGIHEAMNVSNQEYGLERLKQILTKNKHPMTAKQIYQQTIQDVNRFTGASKLIDDQTLVIVKFPSI